MSLGNLKLNEIKHLFYNWFARTISCNNESCDSPGWDTMWNVS